ncbi:MAG: hypothetical protein JXA89_07235 [Anaerolineae bacterium]|nr:hypothetical protein [Anaerolineae bacterium]
MELWMIPVGLVLILVAVPVALLGAFGLVVLAFKLITVVQKAVEPPTVDQSGEYTLDQGKEVGRQQ